jgi:hypothetical protein
MDNESASKFMSVIHDITALQQFLIGIEDMISRRIGTPIHIFNETLHCLDELKVMVRELQHVSDREAGRKLRREWLERQRGRQVHVDVNWCCICHKSGCTLE